MLLPLLFTAFAAGGCSARGTGSQVLEVDQREFNVMETVLPPSESNVTSVSATKSPRIYARPGPSNTL